MKTRIAPTPSGYLHLGNVLSFATTAFLAAQANAKILLRIDDLDQERVNDLHLQDIFDTLNFLKISWHEGPRDLPDFSKSWSQLHRMELYRNALQTLADTGQVFPCTCSRTQLRANVSGKRYSCDCNDLALLPDTVGAIWRLRTEREQEIPIRLLSGTIERASFPGSMQGFVVRKKDGFPAYQLTSMVDDRHFGIDLVVRGEDLWPSTVAQHYLSTSLGQDVFSGTSFYHHPLLTEAKGVKLSKSAGATSIKYLRENGQSAADIYSLIAAMLGVDKRISHWGELAQAVLRG